MIKSKKWVVLENDSEKIAQISKKHNISPLIASVILNRGLTQDEEIKQYIAKDDSCFYDPFLLTDMKKAVEHIKGAVNSGKKIAVYGDYDVDGITSTFIIYDYLKSLGSDVIYYIPDRADEGYGVNSLAIEQLKEKQVDLIITVDVGITAVEETEFAKKCGIDIIITDHHTPKDILPDAIAVINPKRHDDKYPNSELAGVGVAYKLVCALSDCDKNIIKKYSEAAAIGTIADMVPLKGENRFIASFGLENLKTTDNVGLCALMEVSGIDKAQITSANISFGIAPRLNAAGRIALAGVSVDLLLEKDAARALEIAQTLDNDNKIRQSQEHDIMQEADDIITKNALYNDDVIVVAKKGWHHGVIGIVSSKITEKYYKPSAVISINDDKSAKASGRSVSGFNLFDALSACSDCLTKFGGHELAAGFSLNEENISLFREKINEYAKAIMTEEILTPKLVIDGVISPDDISCSTAKDIEILEPFGIGNKTPVFCVNDAEVSGVRIHRSGKHAFLMLEKYKSKFEAPAFNMADTVGDALPGEAVSVAGTININSFRGVDTVQFIVRDVVFTDKSTLNDEILRKIFVCLKNYVSKNVFRFKLSDIKDSLNSEGINIGITKIKTALRIFAELELVLYQLENNTIAIKRGKNFYSKCNLSDSATYNKETDNKNADKE